MQSSESHEKDTVKRIIRIGTAFSSTHDLKTLLKLIMTETCSITSSDGGSIFLKEGAALRFVISMTASIDKRRNATVSIPAFRDRLLPINNSSIAGYAAGNSQTLVIDDAYGIPADKPYVFNPAFDQLTGYRTRNILSLPMLDEKQECIGVLQLINHLDSDGGISPFGEEERHLAEAIASLAAVAVRNAQLLDELKDVHFDTVVRLTDAVEFRDNETGNHVKRVAEYCRLLAERLEMPAEKQELLKIASTMHDVGKIAIPDAILQKPGKLTPEEFDTMKTHTTAGRQILSGSPSPLLQLGMEIAWTHHEKWDGSGYPRGLSGEEIPLVGRIVALADVFDALSSKRCYKDAFPEEKVLQIIREGRGTHFDPQLIDIFFDIYPRLKMVSNELKD